jgi:hypothetical protein
MSCWVVPSVAAELWGVPVQQILDGVKAGQIPSKTELGRQFIDVAPDSPKIETATIKRHPTLRPPTFTVVSSEEIAALTDTTDQEIDEQSADLGDWHTARRIAQDRRRAPSTMAA